MEGRGEDDKWSEKKTKKAIIKSETTDLHHQHSSNKLPKSITNQKKQNVQMKF